MDVEAYFFVLHGANAFSNVMFLIVSYSWMNFWTVVNKIIPRHVPNYTRTAYNKLLYMLIVVTSSGQFGTKLALAGSHKL